MSSTLHRLPPIYPFFTFVDPDPYWEYGSGSTHFLNMDSIWIRIPQHCYNILLFLAEPFWLIDCCNTGIYLPVAGLCGDQAQPRGPGLLLCHRVQCQEAGGVLPVHDPHQVCAQQEAHQPRRQQQHLQLQVHLQR